MSACFRPCPCRDPDTPVVREPFQEPQRASVRETGIGVQEEQEARPRQPGALVERGAVPDVASVQLLFEGVTLGAVSQRPAHPVDGYLAFGALVLYLVGVASLPAAAWHMVRAQVASGYQLSTKNEEQRTRNG